MLEFSISLAFQYHFGPHSTVITWFLFFCVYTCTMGNFILFLKFSYNLELFFPFMMMSFFTILGGYYL